jgi:hypothetical protein
MRLTACLAAALALAPLAGLAAAPGTPVPVPVRAWEIGPVIQGHNYSRGLFAPSQFNGGWGFQIGPTAEPHYVTFRHGSLSGKREIRMRFRIDGPPGAIVYGAKCAISSPSAVTLYFQRRGDDWSSDGERWFATFASVPINGPRGETEIVAPLNARWTSVERMTAENSPAAFAAAKADADRVGFTFGNCEGFGHGARATMPVRFVVTRFEVI